MCPARRLSHSKNGFVIVTFQPSLSIVGEDFPESPQTSSYVLPKCVIPAIRKKRSAGKAEVGLVSFQESFLRLHWTLNDAVLLISV